MATSSYIDTHIQPLSEIFSAAHNQVGNKSNASPKRSPAKPVAPTPPTTTANAKDAGEDAPQPPYPDLNQNLNSFPQYNTDSGYHGMPDDEEGDDEDDVVLTQVQTESQTSTQPLENGPVPDSSPAHGLVKDRRTTESSFHSAHEDIRQREDTAEPMNIDSTANHKTEVQSPKPREEKDSEASPVPVSEKEPEKTPEPKAEQEAKPQPAQDTKSQPEPESEPEPEPVHNTKSSPVNTPATQHSQPQLEENAENDKDDMALDNLDDIGSPSDGSTPERPPIRKSSLTFASLPAREPLMKKSLGGTRMSRTSHIDIAKPNNAGGSGYLGRQTGGHRTTQAALDEGATQGDRMDLDDDLREGADADTRASKLHNKSSTQRLHEKISMLGKLQPSRPTKSIPSVSGLSSAQVSYPELPPVSKTETRPEAANRRSQNTPAPEPEPMATDDEDWIKPLNTPQRPNLAKSQTMEEATRTETKQISNKDDAAVARHQDTGDQMAKANEKDKKPKSTTPIHSPQQRPGHQKSASASVIAAEASTTPVGSPDTQNAPLSASKWRLQSIMKSAKGLFSNTDSVSAAAKVEASSADEPREQPEDRATSHSVEDRPSSQPAQTPPPTKQEGRRTRSSTEREEKRRQQETEDREREEKEQEEQEEKAREQEKQKAIQHKAAQEKASLEREERTASVTTAAAPSPKKIPQPQKHASKEPEPSHETSSKSAIPPPSTSQQQQKQPERRPVKPTREPTQKPRPQPVSIRVGSALSRQIPIASNSNAQESTAPAPTPASTSKPSTLKKKTSNQSLHTASSNSSFKSSVSNNSQRKAQLASERKKEQEERDARRKEEQRREMERKRAAQQQEEARRQELRRAEAERREKERHASEDPKKAAHMQAIEKRRLENARRLERQGSQQPGNDTVSSEHTSLAEG